jgi:hypothetical protein
MDEKSASRTSARILNRRIQAKPLIDVGLQTLESCGPLGIEIRRATVEFRLMGYEFRLIVQTTEVVGLRIKQNRQDRRVNRLGRRRLHKPKLAYVKTLNYLHWFTHKAELSSCIVGEIRPLVPKRRR